MVRMSLQKFLVKGATLEVDKPLIKALEMFA